MSAMDDYLKTASPVQPAVTSVMSSEKDKIVTARCEQDREFLRLNPDVDEFDRPLVKGEEGDAFDFPACTIVRVMRGDHPGMRVRAFMLPSGAPMEDRKKFAAELKRVCCPAGQTISVVDVDKDLTDLMKPGGE